MNISIDPCKKTVGVICSIVMLGVTTISFATTYHCNTNANGGCADSYTACRSNFHYPCVTSGTGEHQSCEIDQDSGSWCSDRISDKKR